MSLVGFIPPYHCSKVPPETITDIVLVAQVRIESPINLNLMFGVNVSPTITILSFFEHELVSVTNTK